VSTKAKGSLGMRKNTVARTAAVLVGLEGAALMALAVWQTLAIASGDTAALDSAIALLVLTVVGIVTVMAFAVAIWRGRSWGRSGAIVTQILILAVALGAATGAYAHPWTALILAAPALVTLVLLVIAVRDAGRGVPESVEDTHLP
jgi:multisubunit Na+/H+ antiporter MnhF subunit